MALVLFMLGCFGLMLLHARQILRYYQEHVDLIMEFKDTAAPEQIDSLQAALEAKPYILPGTVRYISQEQAAAMMRKEFGEDFLALNLPNPFYDIITFNVRGNYMNPDSLKVLRKYWRAQPAVSDVFYQESLLDTLAQNIRQTKWVLIALGIFFVLIVGILVFNTVRLALYANRFLIKTMELAGASWGFISRPYLLRALLHGFISAAMANTGVWLLLRTLQQKFPELLATNDIPATAVLFGGIFLLGMLIYAGSTWAVVNKYLSMRMNDLY